MYFETRPNFTPLHLDHLICWSEPEGKSFVIRDQTEFAKSLLPYYYKHSNMASFVRQLNMYDFHKVMNVEAGGLRGERDEVEFAHPYFERGQDHLLEQIKRKVSLNTRGGQLVPVNTEKVTEVLSEVGMLKNRQEDLDEKLTYMRNENSELWKEVENLRQKHERQQRIVNKLIQFLGAMVQGQSPNGIGMKRKLKPSLSMIMAGELAIEEEHSGHKEPKVEFPSEEPERQEPLIQEVTEDIVPTSVITQASGPQFNINSRPRNNTNHVLANLTPYVEPESKLLHIYCKGDTNTLSIFSVEPKPNTNPMPAPPQPLYTPMSTVVTPFPLVDGNSMVPAVRPKLQRQITKEDFDLDVNNMQAELESLKDILSGQISIDTTMVSSLFDAENGELPTL